MPMFCVHAEGVETHAILLRPTCRRPLEAALATVSTCLEYPRTHLPPATGLKMPPDHAIFYNRRCMEDEKEILLTVRMRDVKRTLLLVSVTPPDAGRGPASGIQCVILGDAWNGSQ